MAERVSADEHSSSPSRHCEPARQAWQSDGARLLCHPFALPRNDEQRGNRSHPRDSTTAGFGRFAPSPTGDFHLGNLRTALLAWSFARNAGLGFLMRMEDLDARSRPEYATRQLSDLEALGIDWDGSVIWQSQLSKRYEEVFAQLKRDGLLYECYCTRRELANVAAAPHTPPGSYAGTCRELTEVERAARRAELAGTEREPAMRLQAEVDNAEITGESAGGASRTLTVHDDICGSYTGTVDDIVIRRGDGVWSYNFVSVLDDGMDGVVQVVRGNDLLASVPRQAHLASVLGYEPPAYAHVPMVFNTAGARLAKRDGAVTMRALAEFGWTPADIVQLLGRSLAAEVAGENADKLSHVRSAQEFAEAVTMEAWAWPAGMDAECLEAAPGVWMLDATTLEAGPRVVLQ